jgi:lauroyl/myristoyl acyltransferase
MQSSPYIQKRNYLINEFINSLNIGESEYLYGQMNMVSAGLVNYLPAIPIAMHEGIYKQILLHKKLSILEQSDYAVLDHVHTSGWSDSLLTMLKSQPTVICTFHTGSYRLLNLFLCRHQIDYTLVIATQVVKAEAELFSTLYHALPGNSNSNNLNIIDAEAPNALIQMLRELKKGRSLLFYIDGNTGAGSTASKNDNCCIIDFLNQQIYARKGIAYIAHLAKAAILPVVSYRSTWENIHLKFFEPIVPDRQTSRDQFAVETTQQLYDLVAPIISQHPEQWEGWLYLHKSVNIINQRKTVRERSPDDQLTNRIMLDSHSYGLCKINGLPFLLQKNNYSFYEISNTLYDTLRNCANKAIAPDCLEENTLRWLYKQRIINYV